MNSRRRRARQLYFAAAVLTTLAVLAIPVACLTLIAVVWGGALILALLGLFNWQLAVWLGEMTVFFWLFVKPGDPGSGVLVGLVWSGLVFFTVGATLVLRRVMQESTALVVSLVLAIVQMALIPFIGELIVTACEIGAHCPCAR